MENKIKILYILFTDIRTGAGTEKAVYYYIKNANTTKYDITVMDTNLMPGGQRITDEELTVIKNKAKFIKIKDYSNYLDSIKNKIYFYFMNIFLTPILFYILKYTKYKNTIKSIGKFDIIYLFNNKYSYIFNNASLVVGSNHGAFDNINSFRQKILAILINYHLIEHKINAYNFFTFNGEVKKYLNNKNIIFSDNGVDTDLYFPNNHINNTTKLLFVARLEESKGIKILIDIYNILIEDIKNIELNIVGSGSFENEIKLLSQKDKNIKFFTHVSENELSEIYRSCDIFVYPTLGDTFSLVVLQALSSGLKVVTTNIMKPVYSKFEKFNAIKFVEPNAKQMANEIIKMLDVNINKNDLYQYIINHLSWKKMAENLYDQFDKLLKTHKEPIKNKNR